MPQEECSAGPLQGDDANECIYFVEKGSARGKIEFAAGQWFGAPLDEDRAACVTTIKTCGESVLLRLGPILYKWLWKKHSLASLIQRIVTEVVDAQDFVKLQKALDPTRGIFANVLRIDTRSPASPGHGDDGDGHDGVDHSAMQSPAVPKTPTADQLLRFKRRQQTEWRAVVAAEQMAAEDAAQRAAADAAKRALVKPFAESLLHSTMTTAVRRVCHAFQRAVADCDAPRYTCATCIRGLVLHIIYNFGVRMYVPGYIVQARG